MKKLLVISLCVLAVACTKTPEQKAEALIKDAMCKSLVLPETYQVVETQLDSAYTPIHDPEFVSKVLEMNKIGLEIDELEKQVKRAKYSMSLWSGTYRSAFGREQYNQAKDKYDEVKAQYDSLVERLQRIAEDLKQKAEEAPEFIGYFAHHRYRANNNAGYTLLNDEYFLLDKEITRIVAQWNDKEMAVYNDFLKLAAETAEATK